MAMETEKPTTTRITIRWLMVAVSLCALSLALAPAGAWFVALFLPVTALLTYLKPEGPFTFGIILLLPVMFAEVIMAMPIPAWFYANLVVALAGFPLAWGKDRWRDRRVAALLLPCMVVLLLYAVPWSTRKPFLRHLYSIKPGMTVAEVRNRMAGYMEYPTLSPLAYSNLDQSGEIQYRHSEEASFNADLGYVYFTEGKVTSVRFSPD